jgi:hypothetical protein
MEIGLQSAHTDTVFYQSGTASRTDKQVGECALKGLRCAQPDIVSRTSMLENSPEETKQGGQDQMLRLSI